MIQERNPYKTRFRIRSGMTDGELNFFYFPSLEKERGVLRLGGGRGELRFNTTHPQPFPCIKGREYKDKIPPLGIRGGLKGGNIKNRSHS